MPNHFHLLIQQLQEGGITAFMRKVADSYTRYFNTKHERIGSLFQGKFKAKLVDSEEYPFPPALPARSAARRAGRLPMWEGKDYPYSSYQCYLKGESHPFCDTNLISSYFSKTNINLSYKAFVEGFEVLDPSVYSLAIDQDDH